MNGYLWHIYFVKPNSPMLVDRTNTLTVGTTDIDFLQVFLSNKLRDSFLMRVLIHELGHCALYSYHLLDDIHRMTYPDCWVEMEEWACNLIADYGFQIYNIGFQTLGYKAWEQVPKMLDKRFA